MIVSETADWAVVDTDFPYAKMQVNAWGVPADVRDEYICRVSFDQDTSVASLYYFAPNEYFDPALVKMYPQIWTGDKFGNAPTGNPDYPARLSGIDKINVTMECNEVEISPGTERNIAFEAFFHSGLPITGPGHPSGQSNKVYELMVWFDKPASNIVPSNNKIGTVDVGGYDFTVYAKDNYVAFIADAPHLECKDFDFMGFVHTTNLMAANDLRLDQIDADWYLSALEFGVEVWSGSGTVEILKFEAEVTLLDVVSDEQPESGIRTPVEIQSGLIQLMERSSHNHILIAERHRDIAADYSSFAQALRNDN